MGKRVKKTHLTGSLESYLVRAGPLTNPLSPLFAAQTARTCDAVVSFAPPVDRYCIVNKPYNFIIGTVPIHVETPSEYSCTSYELRSISQAQHSSKTDRPPIMCFNKPFPLICPFKFTIHITCRTENAFVMMQGAGVNSHELNPADRGFIGENSSSCLVFRLRVVLL